MIDSAVGQRRSAYTVQFWMLCVSSLLFFASFNMLIPELPSYLTSLGGGEYQGLIIALFTLTAMLSRPFSGKLADSVGRVPIIVFGGTVCVICSLMYPILTSVVGFLVLRFFHGFSTGFTPTGQSAYVSDLIPAERRGEAMGLLGTIGSIGMAGGTALGGWIAREFGVNTMFYLSSAFGLGAASIVMSLKETLPTKRSFRFSMLKVKGKDIFEPRVILPCIIMVLAMFAYGAMLTLIARFGEHLGIYRRELLFTYFVIATILSRLLLGRASDKYGRVPVLVVVTAVIMIAMFIISVSETKTLLIVGVCIYGLAFGGLTPTLLAWATDVAQEGHRGRAISSLYIFMEAGIGLGALVSGWLGQWNFFIPFVTCAVLSGSAFITLLLRPLFQKS